MEPEIKENVDFKELEALLHQAETFRPHLTRQLQVFGADDSVGQCDPVRVIDIGCGPCPSLQSIISQLQKSATSSNRRVEVLAVGKISTILVKLTDDVEASRNRFQTRTKSFWTIHRTVSSTAMFTF